MGKWILLIVALVLNAGGNLLLKLGATIGYSTNVLDSKHSALKGMVNMPTLCGLILFAANVLVYRKALENFAVSFAYPIMVAGSLALVTTAAVAMPTLNEKVGGNHIVGLILIVAGIWFLSRADTGSI